MIAKSFGFLASNSSATRGRPPVMSRVFEDSRGMRARTSPALTGEPVGAMHLGALVSQQPGAVGHAVARLLASRLVDQHQLAVAAHHDRQPGRVDHDVAVLDFDLGVERRLDRGLLGAALCRTAYM